MKVTNELLREAKDLQDMIRAASSRLSEIKDACKARGSFSTTEFVVLVKEIASTRMVSLSEAEKVVSRKELEKMGFVKETSCVTVSIEAKTAVKKQAGVA